MRIAYLGSGEFGLPSLQMAAASFTLVGAVSQPDKPAGRGGKLTPTPIAAWITEHHSALPLIKPVDVNSPEIVDVVHSWKPDLLLIIAFGQKLSARLLGDVPAINLHASLLPRWRGAAPINWAILGGDTTTGNSVISIAERMDAGLIYGQSRREIRPEMTAGELHDALSADGPALVERVVREISAGAASPIAQEESLRTRAPKLSREMARLTPEMTGEDARRTINGLSPWPGVTASCRGAPLKLVRATRSAAVATPQGAAIRIVDPLNGIVAFGEGTTLRLLEVQPAGKRVMPWRDFANGAKLAEGEGLEFAAPGVLPS